MSQMMRDRVMNKFRRSGLEFLVATDVAARGIDVDDVEVVFNYDLPYDVEDYVHRIGRTGRAGRSGRAISFVAGRELFQIRNIERFTNMRVHRGRVPTAGEVEEARENVFVGKVRATLQAGDFKRQDALIERLLEEGFTSTDICSALLHHLQSGGESTPAKPAKEESFARPERPERVPYQERSRPERYESRPQRDEPPVSRPKVPISERIVPPKRPASKPAVHVAPPAAPKPEVKPMSPPPTAERKTDGGAHGVTRPAKAAAVPSAPAEAKPSRKTPPDQTRLFMSIGSEAGVAPIDIVNSIAGETGLPGKVVGKVDVRERHLFVDVSSEHANAIIAKLNRAEIKGQRVKVKVA
jgi:ATP-dependent RNA helicase DeaD